MKTKDFLFFVMPSIIMMVLFIFGPLVSVFVKSFQQTQNVYETVEQERCDPFGCKTVSSTQPITNADGRAIKETKWVGWTNYRAILDLKGVKAAFSEGGRGYIDFTDIAFWGALRFTLMFTLLTLPLVILTGLILAFAVNSLVQALRGPVIFITLLPMIITPVIGALSIRWLFIGDGIITAQLERLTNTNISMFAQGWTIELLIYFYKIWHSAPFAFIIFYAALQTVQSEQIEAARIDGARRLQIILKVIVPHLMPLIVFVGLIHLMDTYRTFDEIIGFNASAFRISLQWLTFDFLVPDDTGNRSIGRASASAILTMIGIAVLLIAPLRNTWKEQTES